MLDQYKDRLIIVQSRINKLEGQTDAIDAVGKAFHLGMVGGSGRNVHRLNKMRERSLDRSIERAKILTILYREQGELEFKIHQIESGALEQKAIKTANKNEIAAEYWRRLKKGDTVKLFTGNEITIAKKNSKTIITENGSKFTAAEIIGLGAAKLL